MSPDLITFITRVRSNPALRAETTAAFRAERAETLETLARASEVRDIHRVQGTLQAYDAIISAIEK